MRGRGKVKEGVYQGLYKEVNLPKISSKEYQGSRK